MGSLCLLPEGPELRVQQTACSWSQTQVLALPGSQGLDMWIGKAQHDAGPSVQLPSHLAGLWGPSSGSYFQSPEPRIGSSREPMAGQPGLLSGCWSIEGDCNF